MDSFPFKIQGSLSLFEMLGRDTILQRTVSTYLLYILIFAQSKVKGFPVQIPRIYVTVGATWLVDR